MAKTIRTFETAFGGIEFRATTDGKVIRLQKKSLENSRFYTAAEMSPENFDELERENAHDIGNPAWFSRAIENLADSIC